MWQDFLTAIGLVLVIEGILPFLSPRRLREAWQLIARLDDATLRITGLVMMIAGLIVIYLVK